MPTPSSKILRTDSHFHLFSSGDARPGARYVPGYDSTFADWRERAAAAGVARGILVQPSFLGTDNSRLCAELIEHSDVLRGIAVVEPSCAAAELHRLSACGVRGIRLNLSGMPHDLGSWRAATAAWDHMLRMGWHVEVLTETGALPQVLAQLPRDMPVVAGHMARPSAAGAADPTIRALRSRARHGAVHVKLSGAYRLEGAQAKDVAQALLGELGPASLLWGSDWPCTNHEQSADYPRLHASLYEWVGQDAAEAALGTNPEALYWAREAARD